MRFMKRIVCAMLMAGLLLTAAAADGADFTYALNSAGTGYVITGYTGQAENVTVPSEYMGKPVLEIGSGAFAGNTVIRIVNLPSCITRIGSAGFKGCSALTTVNSYQAEEPAIRIPGDVDGNGAVNFDDVLLLMRFNAGEGCVINLANADVNADGQVDEKDGLLLMQLEAGWDVKLQ